MVGSHGARAGGFGEPPVGVRENAQGAVWVEGGVEQAQEEDGGEEAHPLDLR
jgi:hypothetical protein